MSHRSLPLQLHQHSACRDRNCLPEHTFVPRNRQLSLHTTTWLSSNSCLQSSCSAVHYRIAALSRRSSSQWPTMTEREIIHKIICPLFNKIFFIPNWWKLNTFLVKIFSYTQILLNKSYIFSNINPCKFPLNYHLLDPVSLSW